MINCNIFTVIGNVAYEHVSQLLSALGRIKDCKIILSDYSLT